MSGTVVDSEFGESASEQWTTTPPVQFASMTMWPGHIVIAGVYARQKGTH